MRGSSSVKNQRLFSIWLLTMPALVLACSYFHTAWVSDDAYISFRVIRNVLEGNGLVWNIGERVQVYTHPLWVLLLVLVTFFINDPYFGSLALSAVCLGATAFFTVLIAPHKSSAAVAILVLSASRIFMDYSSSGLENPLAHALVAALAFCVHRSYVMPKVDPSIVVVGSLFGSLLFITRMDLVLVSAPLVGFLLFRARVHGPRRTGLAMITAILPALAWLTFATYYYGSPFPNTYFAKLATGIAATDLQAQGLRYLWESARFDWPSALLILVALCVAPFRIFGRLMGVSIFLYVAYVVHIGGDFMVARFFSVPLILSVFILLDFIREGTRLRVIGLSAMAATFLFNVPFTILSPSDYLNGNISEDGIADERGFFNATNGLQRNLGTPLRHRPAIAQVWMQASASGATVFETCYVGMVGYYAPKRAHIVDGYGLTDPLLARLPALKPWRIGHFERPAPPGYLEHLAGRSDEIADPDLRALWADLELAHRMPLDSKGRLDAILRLNGAEWHQLVERSEFADKVRRGRKRSMFDCRGVDGPSLRVIDGRPASETKPGHE